MIKNIFSIGKLKNNIYLVLNVLILALIVHLFLTIRLKERDGKKMFGELAMRLDSLSQTQLRIEQSKHPKVTSNQDFKEEKSNFTFSPDKKLIVFVERVFEEYGDDWDRYWALKIYNLETDKEKTLIVDDSKMSSYEWLDNNNLRVFHSAGTGVRVYVDVSVHRTFPLFTKDYEGSEIWTPDMEYAQKVKDTVESRRVYLEKTQQ